MYSSIEIYKLSDYSTVLRGSGTSCMEHPKAIALKQVLIKVAHHSFWQGVGEPKNLDYKTVMKPKL